MWSVSNVFIVSVNSSFFSISLLRFVLFSASVLFSIIVTINTNKASKEKIIFFHLSLLFVRNQRNQKTPINKRTRIKFSIKSPLILCVLNVIYRYLNQFNNPELTPLGGNISLS